MITPLLEIPETVLTAAFIHAFNKYYLPTMCKAYG